MARAPKPVAENSPKEDSQPKPKTEIKIPYAPRPLQRKVHDDKTRHKVIVAHRRFGKTTLALNELIRAALMRPNARFWYVAPTYRQAKTIAYDLIQRYLPSELVVKRNENDLTFKLWNGSEIALKGAENKDSLRGVGLKGLVLDEYELMDRDVWEAILEPTLNDNPQDPGWAIFLGTPNGRNHFFELFMKDGKPGWKSYKFSALETNQLDPAFIDRAREDLPEDTFRQEYLAEFLEGEGTVFRGLKACIRPPEHCYDQPRFGSSYQMGVDLARLRDYTVLTVVNQDRRVVYWERLQRMDWEFQKLKIMAMSEQYGHCRVVIDATGVGDPVATDLERYGCNILAYKMQSSEPKRALIENLKLRIEQGQIIIPNERELVRELEAYRFEITDRGRVIFEAPSGFHDDAVISLALAVWDMQPGSGSRYGSQIPEIEDDF